MPLCLTLPSPAVVAKKLHSLLPSPSRVNRPLWHSIPGIQSRSVTCRWWENSMAEEYLVVGVT